jgi:protease-4
MRHLATSLLIGLAVLCGCTVNVPLLPGQAPVDEHVVREAEGKFVLDKVAILEINGVINAFASDGVFQSWENTVALFKEKLERAADDSAVKAVVIRISSPGGGVTASDILYEEIRRFRKRSKKKVVVWMMDVAASGGVYVAMAGDKVVAHPTAVTGSIGVIAVLVNVEKLAEKVGVEATPIKSGAMKDMGSIFRKLTPEERKVFQAVVDEHHERFVQVIADNRPKLNEAAVRKLADGRIFTAKQAKEAGLIDGICDLHAALALAYAEADIDDARVVMYGTATGHMDNVYSSDADAPKPLALNRTPGLLDLLGARRPVFLYLWTPGSF